MKVKLTDLQTAQLTALQNEITPHYIVNTLDAIRMKLLLDGQTESAELLRCFQDSLRTYAWSAWDTVSLEQELSFLKDFLQLQGFRLLGKLTWEFDIEEHALFLQIPRFLLQPIVENAIRHGLDPSMPQPHLRIAARLEEDTILFSVTDNGRGYYPASDGKRGIGLANVNQRLQLLYGDGCAVTVENLPGAGTRASFRLPRKGGDRS